MWSATARSAASGCSGRGEAHREDGQIPRPISPHSLRHAAIANAVDAGVPLRDAHILAGHADPRTTGHYDRARGNLDRHGVHLLTAYVAGV
ncbi:tyrosine-type recombinase/integrase [Ornithinimicrobium pratense]|uniref:Tyrosine-type recombinase/integrase n=1 Tax=Ornithinimicrobium pratense TaxID=2593973 RepID=A0A5J6V3A9_9MICO|nr:tyrosine-type recombinase/integrase [Ornithinimicrobium pratense]